MENMGSSSKTKSFGAKKKKLFGSMEPMPGMTVKKPKKMKKPESMETFHKKRTKKMMGM